MMDTLARETNRLVAKGGKSVYGAPLGILMLETRFARIPGDIGNAETWPFPVLYRVVAGASPERVVLRAAEGLLPAFVAAARDLVALGAEAITTGCGFLSLFQRELAAACAVPVATSSLVQIPLVQASLPPGKRVGVVTVSAASLTPAHLEAAGAPADTPLAGCENGVEFYRVLVGGEKPDLDVGLAAQDVLSAGQTLVRRHPEVGAIVLECTNMPPFAAMLREALDLPIYDITSLVRWLLSGLRPTLYQQASGGVMLRGG